MPSQKPRLNLTLPDDLYATIQKLADLQGVPKTRIITDLLIQHQPILEAVIAALEQINADKANSVQVTKDFAQKLLLDANVLLGDMSKEVKDL